MTGQGRNAVLIQGNEAGRDAVSRANLLNSVIET